MNVERMSDAELAQEERDLVNRFRLVQEERKKRARALLQQKLGPEGANEFERAWQQVWNRPSAARQLFLVEEVTAEKVPT